MTTHDAEMIALALHPGTYVLANRCDDGFDVLVWAREEDSVDDDGARAIARFTVRLEEGDA